MFKAIESFFNSFKNEIECANHLYNILSINARYNKIENLKHSGKKVNFEYEGGSYSIKFFHDNNCMKSFVKIKKSNSSIDEIINNYWNEKKFYKLTDINKRVNGWLDTLAYSTDSKVLLAIED